MTPTRFAPGPATAYVSDDVIAVVDRADVDPEMMRRCVAPESFEVLATMLAGFDEAAVVMTTDDGVHVAVTGAMTVSVDDTTGGNRFDGTTEVVTRRFPCARSVSITSAGATDVDPAYCVDAGFVPVSLVTRTFTDGDIAVDVFDELFGRTVERSVEQAAIRHGDADPGRMRAPFGVLVFSTGDRVIADRTLVIGRNPQRCGDRSADSDASRLRRVALAVPAVSRRHAVVHVDGWHASIDDLGSSNGTWVTLPGGGRRRVRAGQPVDLVAGAVVELGGDVSFSVEEVA